MLLEIGDDCTKHSIWDELDHATAYQNSSVGSEESQGNIVPKADPNIDNLSRDEDDDRR